MKYISGDGAGGATDAGWFGGNWFDIEQAGGNPHDYFLPPGAVYASSYEGTVNNPSDTDVGWATEIFLPWSAVGVGSAAHGVTFAMNFDVILDQDGATRNLVDNRDGAERFELPHFVDDHVQGVHSSYSATQAGIRGPVNYAEVMLVDSRANARPAGVNDISLSNVSAYGAQLSFTSPAGVGSTGVGHVSGYQIRYSTSEPVISEAAWARADVLENNYVPRLSGLSETLRLSGLSPSTQYSVSIRAVDAAGNLGPIQQALSFTTQADDGSGAKVIVSPEGGALIFESGEPFVVVGDHLGISWNYTRNLYPGDVWDNANKLFHNFNEEPSYEGTADSYFDMLEAHGINTMRVYLELQNVHFDGNPEAPNGLYWLENNAGEFNPQMREFVHNILEEAANHGIYIIFSAFDSFSYDEAFGQEGPWATNFGGPLSDINDFFQNPETLNMAKARMNAVIGWVNDSEHSKHVLGYEVLSEWDSYEWTLNSEGESEPGRESEFRRRAQWINALGAYIKQAAPDHLVMNSTIVRDPRGPIARTVFYSRDFDVLTPHIYTNSSEEPINNPASDRSVMPAVENAMFTSYWLTHREDNAPIINGEWGMTRADWPNELPQYNQFFTMQEDEAIFRTVLWSGLASGQAGTGLRIAADELTGFGFTLTSTMRDIQNVFASFANSQTLPIDIVGLRTLAGRVGATAGGHSLLSWGMSDGQQGVVYVLRDGNVSSGNVLGGVVTIDGLMRDQLMDIEIWSTAPGTSGPLTSITGVYVGDGSLSFELPTFDTDVAIKFRGRSASPATQTVVSVPVGDFLVTFRLDQDGQPVAHLYNTLTGDVGQQDVAALSNFRGRVVDMTPFTTDDGQVHLALTDEHHQVWLLSGTLTAGVWDARNLTAETGAPGLTGDLTTYQPSWGSLHIAGLDARGHAINYWWAPGMDSWQHADLTDQFDGPLLSNGLTGYVASWDGLNLAGLNDAGEVVVYWWAPGLDAWQTLNMTVDFEGPTFSGQLDAYVTSWGGLNIAGLDANGHVVTYWWAPGLEDEPNRWRVSNLTEAAGGPALSEGVEVAVSDDGGINVFALDGGRHLQMLRWLPGGAWTPTDVTESSDGSNASLPLGASSINGRMVVGSYAPSDASRFIVFSFATVESDWDLLPNVA